MRRPTIDDVAARARVSIKTVSRVLNHEPHVSTATAERVMSAVDALGYAPNVAARGLAGARSYLLCLLYDNPSDSYVSNVQAGALQRCRREGYHLIVETCSIARADAAEQIRRFLKVSSVDGLILTPPVCDHAGVLDVVRRAGVAFARIAPGTPDPAAFDVRMDDAAAAYQMTDHLIGLGHRRIAFVRGHPDHAAASARLRGFRAAMSDHNIRVRSSYIEQGQFSYRSGMECAARLLDAAPRPTAIFAANDDMAAGVILAAHARHISVPAELSVAGFDDTPLASLIWPQLTTVRQPIIEMADAAVALLVQRKASGDGALGRELVLDFEIKTRGSTAPPASP
jgi:LacI family transcriptional regulator